MIMVMRRMIRVKMIMIIKAEEEKKKIVKTMLKMVEIERLLLMNISIPISSLKAQKGEGITQSHKAMSSRASLSIPGSRLPSSCSFQ